MIFTEKQQYELLASVSARGEIPVKFVYLNEGAEKWDEIYKQWAEQEGVTDEEMRLLLAHMDSFIAAFDNPEGLNLIDLGCGNGVPAARIISKLREKGLRVNYVAVDISKEMIKLASDNLLKEFPDLPITRLLTDFEKDSLTDELLNIRQQTNYPNLLINLGNTLGNYVNVSAVLTNFLESMTVDDYLLIGNGLANDYNPQKIIDTYNIPVIIDTVTSPARSLDIYNDNDDFKYIWSTAKNRVEGRIKLSDSKQVTLAQQKVNLDKGEQVLVHHSYKFSEASLTKMLSDVGFRTELLTTNKNRSHILVMVQPTRYSVA
ncbi:MAG TPA: L-histidine N(alpha)-methyltransferase [Verrucomicrobiae bacterium]|nr:L-histidine N(alpha)-methyltransferase [Verrucomicrobiae bacterium]